MTTPADMREQFEKWLSMRIDVVKYRSFKGAEVEGVWRYEGIATQHDWNIWQAAHPLGEQEGFRRGVEASAKKKCLLCWGDHPFTADGQYHVLKTLEGDEYAECAARNIRALIPAQKEGDTP